MGFEFPKLPRARQIKLAPFDETEIDRSKPLREAPELAAVAERAPGLLSIRPSPLVGQHDVKKELREICDDVIDGEGAPHRLVLLVGPAGAGKSRIAEWLCEVVHEEGTMVPLKARYRQVRGALDGMLGAVTQYFNFERTDRDTIESTLLSRWSVAPSDKNARTWVAGAAEWLRPRAPSLDQPLGPSGMRFALDTLEVRRMVIRYTLRKIANARPLLFVLDDLHHAGQATFEGLLKIHSDEPDQRIVMVATVRAEDVHLGTPAAERLRHLRERMNGAVIEVSPMDTETTCQLIRRSLPLDDAAVLEAARRSRGNPLFALQQLHAWALAGNMEFSRGIYRVPEEVLAVRPQTTAELWDSRVAALPDPHRLAAYAVATLGGDMRREVVHHFFQSLGLSADAALTSLQNAEILIPRGGGRYSWPHALLQEHLAARLEQRRDRRRIYRLAADALRLHPLSNTRRVVRQRVVNLLKGNEPEAAANLLFEFLEHGWIGTREPLATLMDLELLKGRLTGLAFALKNRWQAEALRHVGRNDEARQHAETARDAFEELGDRENLAHVLRVLGHLKSEQAESQDGRTLVMQALEIFSELEHTLGQAQCEAVIGEIDYLLGDYESATVMIQAGEAHFASLNQSLGRGQCLLLLSWIAHSGGETERSRKLTLEARQEFERAGYRLGTAQADASLAHVEHRLMNYYSAELGAEDALLAFETLHTPRGQAACERLLSMIGIDTDDPDMAELHAQRAITLYEAIGDPWGILEAKLLRCQIALVHREFDEARKLLNECRSVVVQEAEPRQHYLLTLSWLCAAEGVFDAASEHLEAASEVFGARTRAGDHTPHLLGRLARLEWPGHAVDRIHAWRALLTDRSRRKAT